MSRWRFTVDQYEQMGHTGVFGSDDRLELLDGDIASDVADRAHACEHHRPSEPAARFRRGEIAASGPPLDLELYVSVILG